MHTLIVWTINQYVKYHSLICISQRKFQEAKNECRDICSAGTLPLLCNNAFD